MKTKKADSMGLQVIIVLVVVIAFALIYFVWLKDFRISGENLSDYTICKNSNFVNAKLKLKIDNQVLQERRGNKCKTEYLDVPKGGEVNFIARKLAGCWDQYLEGKERLFATEDNTYCAICSVLTFDDNIEIKDLTSHLMENDAPFEKDLSYYTYLNRIIITKEQLQEVKNAELEGKLETITTENPLAVIFVEGKDVNPGSLTGMSSAEQAVKGGAIGAVGGGMIILGLGLCTGIVSCTVGAVFIGAGAAITGFLTASSFDPDIDSRVLLWEYTNEDLDQLKCTILEGQDQLEIRK